MPRIYARMARHVGAGPHRLRVRRGSPLLPLPTVLQMLWKDGAPPTLVAGGHAPLLLPCPFSRPCVCQPLLQVGRKQRPRRGGGSAVSTPGCPHSPNGKHRTDERLARRPPDPAHRCSEASPSVGALASSRTSVHIWDAQSRPPLNAMPVVLQSTRFPRGPRGRGMQVPRSFPGMLGVFNTRG